MKGKIVQEKRLILYQTKKVNRLKIHRNLWIKYTYTHNFIYTCIYIYINIYIYIYKYIYIYIYIYIYYIFETYLTAGNAIYV